MKKFAKYNAVSCQALLVNISLNTIININPLTPVGPFFGLQIFNTQLGALLKKLKLNLLYLKKVRDVNKIQ